MLEISDDKGAYYMELQISSTQTHLYQIELRKGALELLKTLSKHFNMVVYTSDFNPNAELLATHLEDRAGIELF